MANSVYVDQGYKNRKDYLLCLSDDFNVAYDMVVALAGMLGPSEDFDGLVNALEDYARGF